jgi:hypothetical protein
LGQGANAELGTDAGISVHFGTKSKIHNGGKIEYLPALAEKRDTFPGIVKKVVSGIKQHRHSNSGEAVKINYADAESKFDVTFDPKSNGKAIGGGHVQYATQRPTDKHPITSRLKEAQKQLGPRVSNLVKGIILCDGGSDAFGAGLNGHVFPRQLEDIVERFLKNNSRVDFIATMCVPQTASGRTLGIKLEVFSLDKDRRKQVHGLLSKSLAQLDEPVQDSFNAGANRRGISRSTGLYGGYEMNDKRIQISARELVHVLSGKYSIENFNGHELNGELSTNGPMDFFKRAMDRGLTIRSAKVIPNPTKDDDLIELQFDGPDPAISPLRLP